MKKLEVNVNIKEDLSNESHITLVFDENNIGGLYKGLNEASDMIQQELRKIGLVTSEGIPTTDVIRHLEQMKPIVDNAEFTVRKLNIVLEEVRGSDLEYKFILEDMVQQSINELMQMVNSYRDMFAPIISEEEMWAEHEVINNEVKDIIENSKEIITESYKRKMENAQAELKRIQAEQEGE